MSTASRQRAGIAGRLAGRDAGPEREGGPRSGTSTEPSGWRTAPTPGGDAAPRRAPVPAPVIVVMGVSGSGKTTVGAALAGRLGVPYADADDFHPADNIAKMAAGTPLEDEDRRPWLAAIAAWMGAHRPTGGVVSCSALRRGYRDVLRGRTPEAVFLHLAGSPEVVARRVAGRPAHFMPVTLVRSQFETLEPLGADERGTALPLDLPVDRIVARFLDWLAGES
jgi:gluconokinase